MPPTQIGPYRIIQPLGQGGMGTVYEAIQEPIQRRVAVKVLLPQHAENRDAVSRFFNEARAVNLIEHPSIVQISDYGQAPDGTAYLVMEYLRGEVLSSRLARLHGAEKRLSLVEVLQIAAQITDALCAAHDKGIIHRDLKPSNIMLVGDPVAPGGERVKVFDFGVAKLSEGLTQGTATNAVIGTVQYMSPEQCRGAGGVTDRADVYSLGVILYEMIAGRPPFVCDNVVEYIAQHLFEPLPPIQRFAPDVPADVATFVQELLVKDKTLRRSMREAFVEISGLMSRLASAPALTLTPLPAQPSGEVSQRSLIPSMPLSTLGGSPGQAQPPEAARRARTLRVLTVAAGAAVILAGLGVAWRDSTRSHGATATVPAPQEPTKPPGTPPPTPSQPDPSATKPPASDSKPRASAVTKSKSGIGKAKPTKKATASASTKGADKHPAPTTRQQPEQRIKTSQDYEP